MKSLPDLLTRAERDRLERKVQHHVGSYRTLGMDRRNCHFRIIIDTINLINLIDSARYGARVYELLSIQRPGDLLHYLSVDISQLDFELVKYLGGILNDDHIYETPLNSIAEGISFLDFDRCFHLFPEDNKPENVVWRCYVDFDKDHQLNNDLIQLFILVEDVKQRLTESDDLLIKQEITLMQQKEHPQDFLAQVDRESLNVKIEPEWEKYQDFYSMVEKISSDNEIKSISCPFGGYEIWRILVEEQVKRSLKSGMPVMDALALYGPDEGLGRFVKPNNWGGKYLFPMRVCVRLI